MSIKNRLDLGTYNYKLPFITYFERNNSIDIRFLKFNFTFGYKIKMKNS